MKKPCFIALFNILFYFCCLPLFLNAQDALSAPGNNSLSAQKEAAVLTVTAPNGGESLKTNTVFRIKWSGTTAFVNIQYSSDNNVSWTTIVNNYEVSLTYYDWNVPALTSANCLVKITDSLNPATTDVSNAVFTVYFPLTLVSPAGGETWYVGENRKIRWNAVGMDSVKIEYSLNEGYTWNIMAASLKASLGEYVWSVPDTMSYQLRIKLTDPNDQMIDVRIPTNIIILHPITINMPNLGESLAKGRQTEIRWVGTNADSVYIKFSRDGGLTWSNIATVKNDSSNVYLWRPDGPISQNCLIRIVSTTTPTIYDQTDKKFSIFDPVAVTAPNGGETFAALKTNDIKWSISGADSVKISYSLNNGVTWTTAVSSFPALTGLYHWSAPDTVSSQALIKVSDNADSLVYDISDAVFLITREKEITLTSPNGGDTLISGSVHEIKWSAMFVDTLSVSYSINNGISWITSSSKYPSSSGKYSWTVPDTVSAQCLIKLVSTTDVSVFDLSDAVFSIRKLYAPSELKAADTGADNGHSITLTWNLSVDDAIIDGYKIYRSRMSSFSGPVDILTLTTLDQIITIEQVTVLLIATVPRGEKTYIDNFVPFNGINYYYWIQAYAGTSGSAKTQSGIPTAVTEKPLVFKVDAPFPNPFNPEVTIRYQLPEKTSVKIRVYDYLGRTVAVLRDTYEESGSHDVRWNGRDTKGNAMASGVYFYIIEAGKFRDSGRMMLVK